MNYLNYNSDINIIIVNNINKSKYKSTIGPDELLAIFVKNCLSSLAKLLSILFNHLLGAI